MSVNDRVNNWAEQHSKQLKVLYAIWCVGLIAVAISFGAGWLELREINFDANEVPVGMLDEEKLELGWDCPEDNPFGSVQDCIDYWEGLSDMAKVEGDYAMLVKLKEDGYMSKEVEEITEEITGYKIP